MSNRRSNVTNMPGSRVSGPFPRADPGALRPRESTERRYPDVRCPLETTFRADAALSSVRATADALEPKGSGAAPD